MTTLVYFRATVPGLGAEPWVSDGTAAGTRLLRDIQPGLFDGDPSGFAHLGFGRVVFAADAPGLGHELWVTTGSEAGTQVLRDIRPGEEGSGPQMLTQLGNGRAVFTANDGAHGRELWVTDGTAAGTRLLKDINAGAGDALSSGTAALRLIHALGNGRAVFRADGGLSGAELWVTDGTPEGTRLLRDINPGAAGGVWIGGFRGLGDGRAVFEADDGVHGRELWVTDGTEAGTRLLLDLNPGALGSSAGDFALLPDGRLRYLAEFTDAEGIREVRTMLTDGTPGGTHDPFQTPHAPRPAPVPEPFDAGPDGGMSFDLFWTGQQLRDGRMVFAASTYERVTQPGAGGEPEVVTRFYGTEPWVTDGTQGGSELLRDIHEGAFESTPGSFVPMPDGRVMFTAADSAGRGLWITDGSPGGTQKLAAGVSEVYQRMAFANGNLLFAERQGDVYVLWITDGTPSGTQRIGEGLRAGLWPMLSITEQQWLFDVFHDGAGVALWVTDGTAAGTRRVAEGLRIDALQDGFTPLGEGRAVLRGSDAEHGREPWIFDLADGTLRLLADVQPGAQTSYQAFFTVAAWDVPIPVSTLFAERASMAGEESRFVLDAYFSNPAGGRLDYTVTGLPAGIGFDAASTEVRGAATGTPGVHPVSVTAANALGGTLTTGFDWTVVDTGLLRISGDGAWGRETPGGPIVSTPGTAVTISHRDGTAPLLRVEGGQVRVEGRLLTVEGTLWSEAQVLPAPLMRGAFTLDMDSLDVVAFADAREPATWQLVGGLVEMGFSHLAITPTPPSCRPISASPACSRRSTPSAGRSG